MMDKVKSLSEWCDWERNEFDQCGCRIRQATDKSVTINQESYARKVDLITMSAHRRKHVTDSPKSDEEHTTMMAKRGELNWLATQTMIQLLAPPSLIEQPLDKVSKILNRTIPKFLIQCLFTERILALSVDISALAITVGWKCRSLLSNLLALVDVPELHVLLVHKLRETQTAKKGKQSRTS